MGLKQYTHAIEDYENAKNIDQNNAWLIAQIAKCNELRQSHHDPEQSVYEDELFCCFPIQCVSRKVEQNLQVHTEDECKAKLEEVNDTAYQAGEDRDAHNHTEDFKDASSFIASFMLFTFSGRRMI